MIQHLKQLFPSLIKMTDQPDINYQDCIWFQTPEFEVVGIPASDLTKRDRQMLEVFLTPYDPVLPAMTQEESYWNRLVSEQADQHLTTRSRASYRFVFFRVQPNQIRPEALKEAIDELFGRQMPVLWINESSGVLIETPVETGDEAISYHQIIDILMSDLYVNIHFFVGPILKDHNKAARLYRTLISNGPIAFKTMEQSVVSYIETVPFMLINEMNQNERAALVQVVLGEFSNDADMLKTLETFILNNLNVSTTAKKLYMHRNSLQYRLDKFIEKTGVDIRQFPQSMTVLLAIYANQLANP